VFCDLGVSQQIGSQQIEALLQEIMTHPTGYDCDRTSVFWEVLVRLPGAVQLNSSAVLRGSAAYAKHLCKLPAAVHLSWE
jgi:hypothetical protein